MAETRLLTVVMAATILLTVLKSTNSEGESCSGNQDSTTCGKGECCCLAGFGYLCTKISECEGGCPCGSKSDCPVDQCCCGIGVLGGYCAKEDKCIENGKRCDCSQKSDCLGEACCCAAPLGETYCQTRDSNGVLQDCPESTLKFCECSSDKDCETAGGKCCFGENNEGTCGAPSTCPSQATQCKNQQECKSDEVCCFDGGKDVGTCTKGSCKRQCAEKSCGSPDTICCCNNNKDVTLICSDKVFCITDLGGCIDVTAKTGQPLLTNLTLPKTSL